jgi:predicted DNA-binding transcriptional regulator YafY
VLLTIQNAIVSRHVLHLEYYVSSRDEWTKREVEPLGLVHYANHWHLLAWCRKRRDVRDFRSDRLRSIKDTHEKFKERAGISLQDQINKYKDLQNPVEVKIQFDKKMIHYVRERLVFGASKEEQKGNDIILTMVVPDYGWLVSPLLSLSNHIKILAPHELKAALVNQAQRILDVYKKK